MWCRQGVQPAPKSPESERLEGGMAVPAFVAGSVIHKIVFTAFSSIPGVVSVDVAVVSYASSDINS